MKTIAVNTRLLLPGKLEGLGRFADETLRRLTKNHPEIRFIFLFDRPFSQEFIYSDNIIPISIFPPARHPLLFYWWFEWSLPSILEKYKADLFLSPDGYLSLSSNVPQLPVIHDLNFEHNPQDIVWYNRIHFQYFFPKYATKASRIATVSEFSAKDIEKRYQIDRNKIDVIYNGVSNQFHPCQPEEKEKSQTKYANGKPYFLYWGAIHPRKNIIHLIQAFCQFKQQTSNPVQLVIAGSKSFWTAEMETAWQSAAFRDEIHFPGRIPENELNPLISGALGVCYTTLFEGFGLPIIEAFAAGTPVITSNVTSMPEIAGNAALLVDPLSVNQIANAMKQLFLSESDRNSLIQLGLERATQFNWNKTTELLWNSIEKVKKF